MQAVEKAKIRHFTPSLDGNYQDQMIQETDQAHLEFSYAIAEAQARLIRLFGIGVDTSMMMRFYIIWEIVIFTKTTRIKNNDFSDCVNAEVLYSDSKQSV